MWSACSVWALPLASVIPSADEFLLVLLLLLLLLLVVAASGSDVLVGDVSSGEKGF